MIVGLGFVSCTGVEGCTVTWKKNDKVTHEDLLNDEVVSEHLTRYFKLLLVNVTILFKKLYLNLNLFYTVELIGNRCM